MDLAATEDTANTSSCLRTELMTIDAVIRILPRYDILNDNELATYPILCYQDCLDMH